MLNTLTLLFACIEYKDYFSLSLISRRKVPIQSKVQTERETVNAGHKNSRAARIKGRGLCAEFKETDSYPADEEPTTLTKLTPIPYSCLDSSCPVNVISSNYIMELQENVMCLSLKENHELENEETFPFSIRVKHRGENVLSENQERYCSENCTRERILEPETYYDGNQYSLSHILTEHQLYKKNKVETPCDSRNDRDDKTTSFCEINLSDQGCKYPWTPMVENTREKIISAELSSLKAEEVCCNINKAKDDQCGLCSKQDNKANDTLPVFMKKRECDQGRR